MCVLVHFTKMWNNMKFLKNMTIEVLGSKQIIEDKQKYRLISTLIAHNSQLLNRYLRQLSG
jgi:hypothetical protein